MSDLKAGRELDALVAEKLFGWRCVHRLVRITREEEIAFNRAWFLKEYGQEAPPTWEGDSDLDGDYPTRKCSKCGMGHDSKDNDLFAHADSRVPKYSTDIASAWLVVEKLVAAGWEVVIEEAWAVSLSRRRGPSFVGFGDTAQLAICKAALLAVPASGSAPVEARPETTCPTCRKPCQYQEQWPCPDPFHVPSAVSVAEHQEVTGEKYE